MDGSETPKERLDAISTRWSLVRGAHAGDATAADARRVLVLRYAKAIRAYVGGMLVNPADADELAQDAVVRLLKGDFAGADPDRGRFRDLLKTAVRNMVRNHLAKTSRSRLASVDPNLLPGQDDAASEAVWQGAWQRNVLDHTWSALDEVERANPGQPFSTLLKLRTEFPDDSSEQLAERLGQRLGRPLRADACRQLLRRARVRFAELLIAEIEVGLAEPTRENVERELADLGLLEHVKDYL